MRTLQKAFKKFRNQLFKLVYFGKKCSCMYCGKSYRRFVHMGARAEVFYHYQVAGAGYRKNARCPNCGSKQRMRLLHLFFELRTDIYRRPIRLLDISPNKGIARLLRSHDNIDHVCGALHPERFSEFGAVKVDATKIGFPDMDFDVVICSHVLEHIREDRKAMEEIFRVLRPGGFAILQVPLALDLEETLEDPSMVDEEERFEAYGQKDHLRMYGMDYLQKLEGVGFRVVRENPFKGQWLPDLDRFCLDEAEDVIVGFKD